MNDLHLFLRCLLLIFFFYYTQPTILANYTVNCTPTKPATDANTSDGTVRIFIAAAQNLSETATLNIKNSFNQIVESQSIAFFPISINFTRLAAGTYTVTIVSTNATGGCSFTITNANCELTATVDPTSRTLPCAGEPQPINATASDGTPPYTYRWSNGLLGETINVAEGHWQLTIIDDAGCQATTTAIHTAAQPLFLACPTESASDINSFDGKINLNINGGRSPFSITIDNIFGEEIQNIAASHVANTTLNGFAAGTYTITVTDALNCTRSCTAVVGAANCILSVNIADQTVNCNGETSMLKAEIMGGLPPYQVVWDDQSTGTTITSGSIGPRTATVTDQTGCVQTASGQVVSPTELELNCNNIRPVSITGLADGTVDFTINGGTPPYTLVARQIGTDEIYDQTTLPSEITGVTISAFAAGSYHVMLTDKNECHANCSFSISEPNCDLTIEIPPVQIDCATNQDARLTPMVTGGMPPYRYQWEDGQTSLNRTNLGVGAYTLSVTDAGNCRKFASTTVTSPDLLTVTTKILTQGSATAMIGKISVLITGGVAPYTYQLHGTTTSGTVQTASTFVLANLPAGDYTLALKDANGCTTSAPVNLFPCNLTTEATVEPVTCFAGMNGSIELAISGNTGEVTIDWSDDRYHEQTTLQNLVAGNYSVVITDVATQCSIERPYTVHTLSSAIQFNCSTTRFGNQLLVDYTITGGEPPYMVSVAGTNIQQIHSEAGAFAFSNVPLSAEQLIITDNNGCVNSCNLGNSIDGCANQIQLTCSSIQFSERLAILYTISGGTPPYTASIPETNLAQTHTRTGNFSFNHTPTNAQSILVVDAKGCSVSCDLSESPVQEVCNDFSAIAFYSSTVSSISAAKVEAIPRRGTSPYTYQWNDGQTTQFATAAYGSTMSVTITDAIGCIATDTVIIPDDFIEEDTPENDNDTMEEDNETVENEEIVEETNYPYTCVNNCNARGQGENYITKVKIGSSQFNSNNDGGFRFYSSTFLSLQSQSTYNIDLVARTTATEANALYWYMAMDINEDGDFNDEGEELFMERGTYRYRTTVQLPEITAQRRICARIAVSINPIAACEDVIAGEIEDYIFILNNSRLGDNGESFSFNTSERTKISQGLDRNRVQVFPNPVQEQSSLYLPMPKSEMITINIYNQLGQLVHQQVEYHEPSKLLSLDLLALKNGLYFLQVETQQGQQQVEKLIMRRLE